MTGIPGKVATSLPLVLLVAFAWAGSGFAADLELVIAQPMVEVGTPIEVRLDVPTGDINIRSIPVRPAATIQYSGTESSVQIVNGQMSRRNSIKFQMTAPHEGRYVLGPVITNVGGKELRSNVAEVVAQKSESGDAVEIRTWTNPRQVFAGQLFREVVQVDYGAGVQPDTWGPPERPGVVALADEQEAIQTKEIVNVGGRTVNRLTLQRWMYAERAGTFRSRKGSITFLGPKAESRQGKRRPFGLDPFGMFGPKRQSRNYPIPESIIRVAPLPEPGAGQQFVGLVGELQVDVDLTETGPGRRQGVLTLAGVATGTGVRIEPWVVNGWRVYPDKPNIRQSIGKSGPRTVVDVPLDVVATGDPDGRRPVWFDPKNGTYQALSLDLPEAPVDQGGPAPVKSGLVGTLGSDPVPVDNVLAANPERVFESLATRNNGLLAVIVSVLLVPIGLVARRRDGFRPKYLDGSDLVAKLRELSDDNDQGRWQEVYGNIDPAATGVEGGIREIIAAALFAPTWQPPVDQVRAWLDQQK